MILLEVKGLCKSFGGLRAVFDLEFEMGIRAVAAPIRDIEGNVIAHMSMPGPTNRLAPERVPEIAQALMEAADAILVHRRTRMIS